MTRLIRRIWASSVPEWTLIGALVLFGLGVFW